MQRIVFALIGLVLVGAIVVTVIDSGKPPPPEHGGWTVDRMSQDQMAKMVAGPMKLVEKKDLAGAARLFETELKRARGKGELYAGDLLDAYGTGLQRADYEKEAMPYFARAIAAYRKGDPGGPILAQELVGYGLLLDQASPDHPPPEAVANVREALVIRERVLGRRNAETAVNYVNLGSVQGAPAITGRDPARVAAAAKLIRTGIQLLPATPNARDHDLPDARLSLVELYARNGDVDGTFKAASEFMAANPSYGPYQLRRVAVIFETAGDMVTGRRLRDVYAIPDEEDDDEAEDSAKTAKAPTHVSQ